MIPKIFALTSVDIYLYSPSENFQIDPVTLILDKVSNTIILGQTQWSITTMYMMNSLIGGP